MRKNPAVKYHISTDYLNLVSTPVKFSLDITFNLTSWKPAVTEDHPEVLKNYPGAEYALPDRAHL